MNAARAAAHIILIHGTWARGAEWMRADAPLRRHLAEALGPRMATTTVSAFDWSGRNSQRAREHAAVRLQASIRQILVDEPTMRIHLIGHSHGGNIALQAVSEADVAAAVDGLVCLATPVIHATLIASSNDGGGRAIRVWTTMAALFLVALIADRLAFDGGVLWTRGTPVATVASIAVGIAALIAFVRFALPHLTGYRRITRHNRRAAGKLDALTRPPRLDPERVVFVRHASDEAMMTANFLGLLGWFSDRATIILGQRYRRLDALLGSDVGRRLSIGFAIASVALIALFRFVRAPETRIVVFALLAMTMAVPPLTSLVLRLVRAVGTLRTMFLGVVVIPIGSFIRLSIEPTPPGAWTVVMLPERPDDETREVEAPIVDAHCRVNQQPEFLAFVSRWIATAMGERASSASPSVAATTATAQASTSR